MRGSRLLIGLLVLATVLVDFCVLAIAEDRPFPHPSLILAWALQLSQVSLMAVWLALGRTTGPLRLIGAVVVAAIWSWALARLPAAPQPASWAVLLAAQTVVVSVPLLVGRWLGLGLVDGSSAPEAEDSAAEPKRLQFSIAYLLGWMTALAVMLGTLQYIAPYDTLPFGLLSDWQLVVCLIGHAMMGWAVLWTALGTRPAARIIAPVLVGTVVGGGLWLISFRFRGDFWYFVMLFVLDPPLLVGSFWVFRVAGYRLRIVGEK